MCFESPCRLSHVSLLVFERQEREGDSNSVAGRLNTLLAIYSILCRRPTSRRRHCRPCEKGQRREPFRPIQKGRRAARELFGISCCVLAAGRLARVKSS